MEKTATCPTGIINAIKYWGINYCVSLVLIAIYWNEFYILHGSTASLLINQIFSAVFSGWLYYKIYKGKNWARITWLITMLLGAYFLGSFFNSPLIPSISKIHSTISISINIYIFYVIFLSSSKRWFSQEKFSLKSTDNISEINSSTQTSTSQLLSSNNYTDINEQHWAAALSEFESGNRKPGLYAKSFTYANGDETHTKVEYLKRRASELASLHNVQIDQKDVEQSHQKRVDHTEKSFSPKISSTSSQSHDQIHEEENKNQTQRNKPLFSTIELLIMASLIAIIAIFGIFSK